MREDAIAENVDRIDEAAGHGLDLEQGRSWTHHAALRHATDQHEQVNVVAGECIGAPVAHRLPDRLTVTTARVGRHASMTVGAREARVMVRVADDAKHVTERPTMQHRSFAIGWAHRMQVGPLRLRAFGASMHRVHLDKRGERGVEAAPIDAARAKPVADVMREGEGGVRPRRLERSAQRRRTVGQHKRPRFEVTIEDRVVPVRIRMDLVAGEDDEARCFGPRQFGEMPHPTVAQPCETLHVEIDNMGDIRIVDRHVGPMGMARDRDEVELQGGARQRILEPPVAVADAAMIVDVAKERSEPQGCGEGGEAVGERLGRHDAHAISASARPMSMPAGYGGPPSLRLSSCWDRRTDGP